MGPVEISGNLQWVFMWWMLPEKRIWYIWHSWKFHFPSMVSRPGIWWTPVFYLAMTKGKTKSKGRCTDGSLILEMNLDEPVTPVLLDILSAYGKLTILSISDPPLYTFEMEGLLTWKGMVGDTLIYIRHDKEKTDKTNQFIRDILHTYHIRKISHTEPIWRTLPLKGECITDSVLLLGCILSDHILRSI